MSQISFQFSVSAALPHSVMEQPPPTWKRFRAWVDSDEGPDSGDDEFDPSPPTVSRAVTATIPAPPLPPAAPSPRPRLLDVMRDRMRTRNMALRTEKTYLGWVRAFLRFHSGRHPRDISVAEVEAFLTHLAVQRHVSASTQNQALHAVLFLYRELLGQDPPWVQNVVRAQHSRRLPVVLTRDEVRRVLDELPPKYTLMGHLLYGTGMRLNEMLALRVKDLESRARRSRFAAARATRTGSR